jgi:hypothetical protein
MIDVGLFIACQMLFVGAGLPAKTVVRSTFLLNVKWSSLAS